LSFRGTLRAEESLILLDLKPGEIPRFARNDKIIYFFRSLFSLSGFGLPLCRASGRLKPTLLKPSPTFTFEARVTGNALRTSYIKLVFNRSVPWFRSA
jgi:hypothetical protein